MGGSGSRCSQLLENMGWSMPQLADEFYSPSLVAYLEDQNLEVTLPRHAPQCDMSIGDRKARMYPRPNFCWEGYKMHLALVGPSSDCKRQFTDFLPKIASVFHGPPSRLGPGREATPHYFFDSELHKLVLWELPEIMFKQHSEDYIRELGLLYIDCVFLLFSDKYTLTDVYCKLCVAMAVHGIPFFVVCTQTQRDASGSISEQLARRITSDFRKKDILVRMLDPDNPGAVVTNLISDFLKEVSWNRKERDPEKTSDVSEEVLGQTVRLQNLEKKPELNGRCGVCIGYDSEQSRYLVRLINDGVETDVALRTSSFTVLKTKLRGEIVRIGGLESRPELNGRLAFVDEFLRESQRYRVFIPDAPNTALTLALKPGNLERVDDVRGARPVAARAAASQPSAARPVAAPPAAVQQASRPAATRPSADAVWAGGCPAKATPSATPCGTPAAARSTGQPAAASATGETSAAGERRPGAVASGVGQPSGSPPAPQQASAASQPAPLAAASPAPAAAQQLPRAGVRAAPWGKGSPPPPPTPATTRAPAQQPPAAVPPAHPTPRQSARARGPQTSEEARARGPEHAGLHATRPESDLEEARARGPEHAGLHATRPESDLEDFLPKRRPPSADDDGLDLMSRILAAEHSDAPGELASHPGAAQDQQLETPRAAGQSEPAVRPPALNASSKPPAPRRRLTLEGLLSFRVWAVVGHAERVEHVVDNLMDFGKTVFTVGGGGAYFGSLAELEGNPALPAAEVLAVAEGCADFDHARGASDAARLGLRGVVLHPSAGEFEPRVAESYRAAGLAVFECDLQRDLEPGLGIAVAPLD